MFWTGVSLVLAAAVGAVSSQEELSPLFVDDFETLENVAHDDTENIAQLREFPRIVTRPDVRINRLNPADYKDTKSGMAIGCGWFPVIIRIDNGDLLTFFREGYEHGMADLEGRAVVHRSTDGGRTWGKATIIDEEPGWGYEPMYAVQAPNGVMWVDLRCYKVYGPGEWKYFQYCSTDNGKIWKRADNHYGASPYLALSNGKLLWMNWFTVKKDWKCYRTTWLTDGNPSKQKWGKWRVHPELGPSDEWSVTETKNPGELVSLMRQQHNTHCYATSTSKDYGNTWTQWRPSDIYIGCVAARPRIETAPDGTLIASYGQRWIGRTFAVASHDGGKTWDVNHRQVMLHSPRHYYKWWDAMYTGIVQAEGDMWLGIDYIMSPISAEYRGIYGTFIDTKYFKDVFHGITLTEKNSPRVDETVGFWRFDEETGEFANDHVGSNYAEIFGATRVKGKVGGALAFDGEDDYAMVYDDKTLWLPNWFTLEAWVKCADVNKEQTILSKAPAYTLFLRDGKPVLQMGGVQVTCERELENDRWQHVVVIYGTRMSYAYVTFFIDGKEISRGKPIERQPIQYDQTNAKKFLQTVQRSDMKIDQGPMFQPYHDKNSSTDNLVIGMDNNLKDRAFQGVIDEVVIHGVDLGPDDVPISFDRGYPKKGRVTSHAIKKDNGAKWTTFKARVTEPSGTKIHFSILDIHDNVLMNDVPSHVDLSGLEADQIILEAVLQTSDPGQTSVLSSWSVGTDADRPVVKRRKSFPNQSAPLAGNRNSSVPRSAQNKASKSPRITSDALELSPVEGLPVDLFGQPVGTSKKLLFEVKHDPVSIEQAWLKVTVDDIDEEQEARIKLNGKPVSVHRSVLGEGLTQGVLTVPVTALVKGRNVFEFVFANDLRGTTEGYRITKARLVLKARKLPL